MRSVAVFDASAVLAMIYGEAGGDEVIDRMESSLLSSVNLLEVHTKLLLNGLSLELARKRIRQLQCEICPVDGELARIASEMIWTTKPFGLSLGDRTCLALAMKRKATVYTADLAWKGVPLPVKIEFIR